MENFVNAIKAIKAGTFANVYYESEEKTPNKVGLGIIKKRTTMRVQMRYSYENGVNNHLEKNHIEGEFVANSLPWGQWVKGNENLLIEHKDKLYLRMYQFANSQSNTMLFNAEGMPLTSEEQTRYYDWKKGLSKGSARQAAMGLTEEDQVKPMAVAIENIISFDCGQVHYVKNGFTYSNAI